MPTRKYADKLKNPLKLADILENAVGENSPYTAVFIPGVRHAHPE
jgi:molecular chaperone Hsp31 and glyoxalase 3